MSDGDGLYLWLTPSGGKLWRWKFRFNGKERTMSFGQYPDLSLAVAREARRLLVTGVDLMAQRKLDNAKQQGNEANSFQSMSRLWLAPWQHGKSPRHAEYVNDA
jgi:hypothetical protein